MPKATEQIKQNIVTAMAVCIAIFLFYFQLINGGIATHDSLLSFFKIQQGTFFSTLMWERFGMALLNAVPAYIHSLCTSLWTFRLFTMLGLLVSVVSFITLFRRVSDNWAAVLFVLLFFAFAQIEADHDGLFSFSFSYQLNTCYVLFGLTLYYEYLKTRKKNLLLWSAFLYLLSSMAYEAFILYGFLFFILDLYYWIDKKKLTILNLFNDLILHALLVTIYVLIYFMIRDKTGIINSDATVSATLTAGEFFKSLWKMTIGLFPLNYAGQNWQKSLVSCFQLDNEKVLWWLFVCIELIAIVNLVTKAANISGKKYLRISIYCVIGMILPNILPATVQRMIDWLCYVGVRSFATSYYSYFFIIAWLTTTVIFLYQVIPCKRIFLVLCCTAIAVTTMLTFVSNQWYVEYYRNLQDKYDLYLELVDSDYFLSIEDDSQLYAPDYIGINYDIDTLAQYANKATGKQLSSINQKDQIDYAKNVYNLRVDTEKDVLYFSKINVDGLTNEIYIHSLKDLDDYGIIADRNNSSSPSMLYIDGKANNLYGTDIITGTFRDKGSDIILQCKDMVADSIDIYQPSDHYTNGIFKAYGLHEQESWGRWTQKEFGIAFECLENTETVTLTLNAATPTQADATLIISCGQFQKTIQADSGIVNATYQIPIEDFDGRISILSSAPEVEAPSDPRSMYTQILGLSITIGDEILEWNTP